MHPPSTSTACRIEFIDPGRARPVLTAAHKRSPDRTQAKEFPDRAAAELALKHLPASLRATAVIVATL